MRCFRITQKDQLVQDIVLNRGTYTFSAWVLARGSAYSIGIKTESGTWNNFSMDDQIKTSDGWNRVKLTFNLYDRCSQFSLMNSFASVNAYVIVAAPMLEEGSNAGTHKPNELDLDESISSAGIRIVLSNESHIFAGSTSSAIPGSVTVDITAFEGSVPVNVPASSIVINPASLPTGMSRVITDNKVTFTVTTAMVAASGVIPILITVDGVTYTHNFSYAISFKGADGNSKDIRLEASTQIIRKLKNGTWNPSTPVTVTATAINTTITKWEYSVNGGTYSESPPIGVTRDGNVVSINPQAAVAYALYSIKASDGILSDSISVIRLEDGTDGLPGSAGLTLFLSNESHIFAGSETAAIAGSATTDVICYKGGSQVTPSSITVGTKPTGMTSSVSGNRITFTVTTAMVTASGMVPITIVADGVSYTLYFSYSISFKGTGGDPGKDGNDGLSKGIYLNAQTNIIQYNAAGTPTPATNFTVVGTAVNTTITAWQYSVNGGAFTTSLPAGVARSGNTVTISPTTVTFNILSIRASDGTISDTVTIGATRDGNNGLPGKLPITTEWVAGDTHLNNDTVVYYIYYRAGNTWWKLKDGITSLTAPAAPNTNYQQLSSMESLVTKVIIAEEGNLAGMIFKDGKLISQKGMINGVESNDYGNPSYVPNILIDGLNGVIKSNVIQTPSVVVDPDIPGDVQAKLTNNRCIYFEASGQVTYNWIEHKLPGSGTLSDKNMDGMKLEIYAPYGCNRRIRIVPAHANASIFVDEPIKALRRIEIGYATRERIQLTAVWDRVYETLDWVITSRVSYSILNSPNGDTAFPRKPLYFKEGDLIARGQISSAGALNSIGNKLITGIISNYVSPGYTIRVPIPQYYSTTGSLLNRTSDINMMEIEVNPATRVHTWINKSVVTGEVVFTVQFATPAGANATSSFNFTIKATDYIINNNTYSDKIE